jgi:hypothetical protein
MPKQIQTHTQFQEKSSDQYCLKCPILSYTHPQYLALVRLICVPTLQI